MAEKAVGIAKTMLKKAHETNQDIQLFLLNYRNAPVAGLQYSPAQLNLNRTLRSKIPINPKLLEPAIIDHDRVHKKFLENQKKQKDYYDKDSNIGENFIAGEKIWLQDPKSKLWEKAQIVKALNTPRSFLVKTNKGKWFRRNTILIKKRKDVQFAEREDTEVKCSENTNQSSEPKIIKRPTRIRRPPNKLNL